MSDEQARSSSSTRTRGPRTQNTLPDIKMTITQVDEADRPIAPKNAANQFRSTCGIPARTYIPITFAKWPEVPIALKESTWERLLTNYFDVSEEAKALVKRHVIQKMGILWKAFKSKLVTEFVREKISPLSEYDFLTQEVWDEFVALKTTQEFQESSEAHRLLQLKNEHPHHLGSAGYVAKSQVWEKEDEDARQANVDPPFSKIGLPRARNWARARAKRNPDGSISFPNESDARVAHTMEDLSLKLS